MEARLKEGRTVEILFYRLLMLERAALSSFDKGVKGRCCTTPSTLSKISCRSRTPHSSVSHTLKRFRVCMGFRDTFKLGQNLDRSAKLSNGQTLAVNFLVLKRPNFDTFSDDQSLKPVNRDTTQALSRNRKDRKNPFLGDLPLTTMSERFRKFRIYTHSLPMPVRNHGKVVRKLYWQGTLGCSRSARVDASLKMGSSSLPADLG